MWETKSPKSIGPLGHPRTCLGLVLVPSLSSVVWSWSGLGFGLGLVLVLVWFLSWSLSRLCPLLFGLRLALCWSSFGLVLLSVLSWFCPGLDLAFLRGVVCFLCARLWSWPECVAGMVLVVVLVLVLYLFVQECL